MKYLNTEIVFQEIPDEISLAINITDCPIRCPDCHSKFLWENVGTELTDLELHKLINYNKGISSVLFMGGDGRENRLQQLAKLVKQHNLKVAWYSGQKKLPAIIDYNLFDYIKIGPYIKECGGLKEATTNQKLYKLDHYNNFTAFQVLKLWKN